MPPEREPVAGDSPGVPLEYESGAAPAAKPATSVLSPLPTCPKCGAVMAAGFVLGRGFTLRWVNPVRLDDYAASDER
jgi:hypothetical protein